LPTAAVSGARSCFREPTCGTIGPRWSGWLSCPSTRPVSATASRW
jgi:hypothetical protein